MCSNPFKSPQGPSHSVLPQGFRIRTKCSVPYVVFTWQRRGEMSYRKGESGTDKWLFCDCLGQALRDIQNIDVTKHFQKLLFRDIHLLYCSERVGMSKHDSHVISMFQRTLEGEKKSTHSQDRGETGVTHRPQVNIHCSAWIFSQQVPPERTWQLAQLMSAPLESRCWRKFGRSRGSDAMVRTSATPPVISTMAS